jgi:ABC-type nitrate/sulfonate/bicarbonate transport system permease component
VSAAPSAVTGVVGTAAPERPAGRPGRRAEALVGAAGVLVAALAWEASTRLGIFDASAIPPLSDVLDALAAELGSSAFWSALARTCESTLLGLAIAVAIALPLGLALGLSARAFRSTRFVVEFLKPIPVVAILPLVLLIYGTTLQMKVVLIVFGTLWPLLIQVLYGVQAVDPVVADTARAFRLGRVQRLARVILPSASPLIATGLRVAAVSALILSIVTELVGGAQGIGFEITRAQLGGDYPRLYALVLVTGLLGLALNAALEVPERRLLRWHPSHRGEAGA